MLFLLTAFALESRCKDTNISRYGKIKFTVYGLLFKVADAFSRYGKIKKMPPCGKSLPRGGNGAGVGLLCEGQSSTA